MVSLNVQIDSSMLLKLLVRSFMTINSDTIDDAFIFCQTCRHGGHASHIIEWFYAQIGDDEDSMRTRRTCPVSDCECYCNEECGANFSQ